LTDSLVGSGSEDCFSVLAVSYISFLILAPSRIVERRGRGRVVERRGSGVEEERTGLTGPMSKHIPSALCAWKCCFWAILAPSQKVTLPSESEVTIV
jgi:hypothetical protein